MKDALYDAEVLAAFRITASNAKKAVRGGAAGAAADTKSSIEELEALLDAIHQHANGEGATLTGVDGDDGFEMYLAAQREGEADQEVGEVREIDNDIRKQPTKKSIKTKATASASTKSKGTSSKKQGPSNREKVVKSRSKRAPDSDAESSSGNESDSSSEEKLEQLPAAPAVRKTSKPRKATIVESDDE